MLFNILMYALMIYMLFRMFTLSKRNKKNQSLIRLVNTIEDEDNFFDNCDEYINTIQDAVFENKARIIKLWGMTYYNRYAGFDQLLEDIYIDSLFSEKNGSITENEDSFFYMYLAIPNLLYAEHQMEMMDQVFEKMKPYDDRLQNQMVKAIGESCRKFYTNTEDRGESLFRTVIDGEYAGYVYSKSLIGLYKRISNAMLIKIYTDQEKPVEEFDEMQKYFLESGIGRRFSRAIGLEVKEPAEEEEDGKPADDDSAEETDDETENISEE